MPRAHAADFQLQIGPITATGRLFNITIPNRNDYREFVSIFPGKETPTRVKQVYVPADTDDGTANFCERGDLNKARVITDDEGNEVLIPVTAEEVEAARASELPQNILRAQVHPASEVDFNTFHTGGAYVFEPNIADEYYALMLRMVKDSDKAFVAIAKIRTTEAFWRLTVWRDQIVVQQLLWPDELNDIQAPVVECSDEHYNAAMSMIDRIERPFTQDRYRNAVRDRMEALEASLEAGERPVAVTPVSDRVEDNVDLMALLNSYAN